MIQGAFGDVVTSLLKRLWILALLAAVTYCFLSLGVLVAQQEEKKVVRVIRLGFVDGDLALNQIQPFLSPDGRATVNRWNDTLVVVDRSSVCDEIEALITQQQEPAPMVRIDIHYSGVGAHRRGGGVSITSDSYPVQVYPPDAPLTVNVHPAQSTVTTTDTVQSISVLSGHEAWIDIGEELPGVVTIWFFRYASRHGYIHEEYYEEIEYRRAGTRLAVRPKVVGELVYIDVIPEMSYFIGDALNSIAFTAIKTTVVAGNGQTVSIGGLHEADEMFVENFYYGHFDSRQRRSSLQITITPHIL